MAEIKNIKTQFIGGEQTSSLNSRVDIDQYYKGVKKALNVAIDQSGTIKRRSGTRIVRELKNGSNKSSDTSKMYTITGEDDKKYLILFYHNSVFYIQLEKINDIINGNSIDLGINTDIGFNSPPTLLKSFDEPNFVKDMDVDVSLNTMVITHPKQSPKILYINESGFGRVEDINFKKLPEFDFNDDNSPKSKPFSGKMTLLRPPKTLARSANSVFSFSLNGQVSSKCNTTGGRFFRVGREIDMSINLGEEFDLRIIESSSGYKFSRSKKLKNTSLLANKQIEDNYNGEESFLWTNTDGDINAFCRYLSIELTRVFFKESCDFVINRAVLENLYDTNADAYMPINIKPVIFNSFNDFTIEFSAYAGFQKAETQIFGMSNELNFVFCAAGYYELEGSVVKENKELPETYSGNPYQSNPQKISVNSSPWGLYFEVKREIQKMNVVSNMNNVFVWNGSRGIFAPWGGGNDMLEITGGFGDISPLATNRVKVAGFDTGDIFPVNGDDLGGALVSIENGNLNLAAIHHIVGDYDEQVALPGMFLQLPSYNQVSTQSKVKNFVFAINIDIKNEDANQYEIDMVNDTNRAEYRDSAYPEDVADEADIPKTVIGRKGSDKLEPAFSELRGYPAKCKFIDRRLCFANTPQLPNRLWFSVVDDFFNFQDDEDGTDISAINNIAPISKAQESIEALTGNKSLQVFTTDSEHYNPSEITASEISLPQQSNYGIKKGTNPVVLDNATFYIDKLNNLRAFIYDDLEQSYKSYNMSVLAKHLMENVFKIIPVRTSEGTFIYCLNNDGSITVFQTLREQNIRNFVLWKNDNVKFKDILEYNGKVLAIANNNLVVFDENVVGDLAITRTKGSVYQTALGNESYNIKYLLEESELLAARNIILNKNYTYTSPHSDKVLYIDHELSNDGDFLNPLNLTNYYLENTDFTNPITNENQFYYYDLREVGFEESGFEFSYNFPVEIETKDIAYDLGRGQELVGRKKFTRAWLSLNNATQWHLYKDGFKYSPTEYFTGYSGNFERITGDVEIRLTGYHNRVNIKLIQDYPLLGGEVQAITLAIKV